MHTTTLSRSPHLSWMGFGLEVPPDGVPLRFSRRATTHAISLMLRGRRVARLIRRGHEIRWTAAAGAVHFVPADEEHQTCLMTSGTGCELYAFWIPREQLETWTASEGLDMPVAWRRLAIDDDPVLRSCLYRLARTAAAGWQGGGLRDDEVARRLLLRLAELQGVPTPDWRRDASLFDGRTLEHLVAYIDAHLRVTPSLDDFSAFVGLSPSHFARKFRRSTGLSLHRFVNLRRLQAALDLLKDTSRPLAHLALDLGFSSQSHFTRLFSGHTGMTPARYRKVFRRSRS